MPPHNKSLETPLVRSIEAIRNDLGFTMAEMAQALGLSRQSYSVYINSGRITRTLELAAEGLLHRRKRSRDFAFLVRVQDRETAVILVRRPRQLNGSELPVPDMTFLVNVKNGNPTVRSLGRLRSIVLEEKHYKLLPVELLGVSDQETQTSNGDMSSSSQLDPDQVKRFLVINDVLAVLVDRAELRVSQILYRLEGVGTTWFDRTLPPSRRAEQLRSILHSESLQADARVESPRPGYYRVRQQTLLSVPERLAETDKDKSLRSLARVR